MKTLSPSRQRPQQGNALLLVIVFSAASILVLAGAMQWTSSSAYLTARNNQYFNTVAAAESATEKVMASILKDFHEQGSSVLNLNKSKYTVLIPTASEDPYWANFAFSDAQGNLNQTYVSPPAKFEYSTVNTRFTGLMGVMGTYRVVSNARQKANTAYDDIEVGVAQEFQIVFIPVFQFAIYSSLNLEINPGDDMTISGRVHGNTHIYTYPNGVTLTFGGDVTAAGDLLKTKHPDDPTSRNPGTIVYNKRHEAKATPLFLPVGTDNTADSVYKILEPPPAGGDPDPDLAAQRYYNKADVILLISNSTVRAASGKYNRFATTITEDEWKQFLATNVTFYDYRESTTINTSELDVGNLFQWAGKITNSLGGRTVRSVYVADYRTESTTKISGVRLKNGKSIPPTGLTVATPNPLYVWGHYNAPYTSGTDATNTTKAYDESRMGSCALVADAVTLLSAAWKASYGQSTAFSTRVADPTTVNAAIFGGMVPTQPGHYSGGIENFLRLLENWDNKKLTYNGSLVVMYDSRKARGFWSYGSPIYSQAIRDWNFDLNFMNYDRLPPGTPEFRQLIRKRWLIVDKNTTILPSEAN